MPRWLAVFVAATLCVACEKIVKQEQLPQYTQLREVSCTYSGFCYTCGFGMSIGDNSTCGFKVSNSCSGKQQATVLVQPTRRTFESGRVDIVENTYIQMRHGSCQ